MAAHERMKYKHETCAHGGGQLTATTATTATATATTKIMDELADASAKLNAASNEFTRAINEIDARIKALNFGIGVWVTIDGPEEQPRKAIRSYSLGYDKVEGKWGLALSMGMWEHRAEQPIRWTFNNAPRSLRIAAIKHIPWLLQTMARSAREHTVEIEQETALVRKTSVELDELVAIL